MEKKISIVIVTYNSYDLILDCINSIFQYNDLKKEEIEIIVVDNSPIAEGERLKKLLLDQYFNDVIFIKNDNRGYGQGNNVGVKISKGEITVIMNPDIRLSEPLFKRTLELFNDNNVASLGFKQINGVADFSFFRFPELFTPILYSIINRRDNNKDLFNQYKYSLSGAFVFFRKKDFVDIGMYDEDFFMYLEEPDVAKRINNIGKKVLFDNSKSYIHLMDHKESFNAHLLDIGTNSIKLYFNKHNLNLKKYIRSRLLELRLHKILFGILGNKVRKEKAEAYTKTLKQLL